LFNIKWIDKETKSQNSIRVKVKYKVLKTEVLERFLHEHFINPNICIDFDITFLI